MARKANVLRLTLKTTLQTEYNCSLLDNPKEYGFNLGVIIEIDSKYVLMLWDTNDRKVFEKECDDMEEAQMGFITGFGPRGMLSLSVPSWTYHEPTADFLDKIKEPVSKETIRNK